MSHSDAASPASKIRFLLLTLGLSSGLILTMLAFRGGPASTLAGGEPAAMARQSRPAASGELDGGQTSPDSGQSARPQVVTAQRGDSRELPLTQKKGGDAALGLPNIADIAETANPAVVNIRAVEIIRPGSQKRRSNPHDPFDFFFPRPDGRGQSPDGPQGEDDGDQRQDSGGTGFLVSEDGFVITNFHVIEEADRVIITLADDSRQYTAKVVGTDPTTDLALLKIDPGRKLQTIPLGDSDRLRVGDWVIAIGNPLAYDHTLTVGVVSAKGRKLRGLSRDVSLDNYIQTDAAINRGNSGGPLLNLKGEAVGINSAISVAGQGISFAIPINMARDVMSQLRDKGKVSRGFLGVSIMDIQAELSDEDRQYFGLENRRGAFIHSVTKGQPADRAGLKKGDAIVAVDGQAITGSDDLIRTISAKPPGAQVSLGIVREGKDRSLTAELIDRPDLTARASNPGLNETPGEPTTDKRLGVTVQDLDAVTRQEYQIDAGVSGVVVTHVSQVSDAWERGLQEGDVITEVNRHPVSSLEQYRQVVEKLKPGDIMALYLSPRGEAGGRFVTLRIGAE
ncbi:MAG TPA: Do family serine endopeptidase [Candidatus Polarisedimenticolia bacterium]|nr:Do family serine endopeptidase [Candidatus Polarisedimenticolia bacterium]